MTSPFSSRARAPYCHRIGETSEIVPYNIREGTPYWYLTKLAAKCTARRMVPDYISEKKMLELASGSVWLLPVMYFTHS